LDETHLISTDSNQKQYDQDGSGAYMRPEYAVSCIFQVCL